MKDCGAQAERVLLFQRGRDCQSGLGSQTVLDDTGGKISHVLVYAF